MKCLAWLIWLKHFFDSKQLRNQFSIKTIRPLQKVVTFQDILKGIQTVSLSFGKFNAMHTLFNIIYSSHNNHRSAEQTVMLWLLSLLWSVSVFPPEFSRAAEMTVKLTNTYVPRGKDLYITSEIIFRATDVQKWRMFLVLLFEIDLIIKNLFKMQNRKYFRLCYLKCKI